MGQHLPRLHLPQLSQLLDATSPLNAVGHSQCLSEAVMVRAQCNRLFGERLLQWPIALVGPGHLQVRMCK